MRAMGFWRAKDWGKGRTGRLSILDITFQEYSKAIPPADDPRFKDETWGKQDVEAQGGYRLSKF